MLRNIFRGVLVVLLGVAATAGYAQTSQPKTEAAEEVLRIDTKLVVLDAQVLQKTTGRVLGNLKAENFELEEEGKKQEISYFSQDKLPLSVVLLLDVSGSMQPVLDELKNGAMDSLNHLKPQDEVAVMAFATNFVVTQEFTKDRALILKGIDRVTSARAAGSGTNINEGIYGAATEMSRSSGGTRRVIVIVTDNESKVMRMTKNHSQNETESQLFENETVVCGVIVRSGLQKTMGAVSTAATAASIAMNPIGGLASIGINKAMTKTYKVENYSEKTGGEIFAAKKEAVAQDLAKMFDHLRTRYSIGYYSSNPNFDGKFRKLKLKVKSADSKQFGDVAIKTKKGYYAKVASEAASAKVK